MHLLLFLYLTIFLIDDHFEFLYWFLLFYTAIADNSFEVIALSKEFTPLINTLLIAFMRISVIHKMTVSCVVKFTIIESRRYRDICYLFIVQVFGTW